MTTDHPDRLDDPMTDTDRDMADAVLAAGFTRRDPDAGLQERATDEVEEARRDHLRQRLHADRAAAENEARRLAALAEPTPGTEVADR